MSETSSSSDVHRKALLAAIDAAALSARRNQTRFWFLSVTWAVVISILGATSIWQSRRLETQAGELQGLEDVLIATRDDLAGMRSTLQELKDTFFGLATLNFDNLPEESRGNLGTQLAEQAIQRKGTSSGGRLSEPERIFLEQFSDTTGAENGDPEPIASAEDAYRRGSAAVSRGDTDTAMRHFSRAVEDFDEPYAPAYLGLGRAYFEADRFIEAIAAFDDGLQVRETASIRSWRCFTKNRIGIQADPGEGESSFREALEDCDMAIAQDPSYWWSYNTRGFSHLLLGDYDDAVSDWRAAAARHNDPAYPLENIGLAYISAKRWQAALDHTSAFIREHGTNSAWNWLARAVAADQLGSGEAVEALERWRELRSPGDVEGLKRYLSEELHLYLE